MAAALLGENLN
jgi:hypothetical protein